MKMKHLKTFENFSEFGRFTDEDELVDNQDKIDQVKDCEGEDCDDDLSYEEEREKENGKIWGDEIVEKKKNECRF